MILLTIVFLRREFPKVMMSHSESSGNPNLKGLPNLFSYPLWLAGEPVFPLFFVLNMLDISK